MKNLNFKNFNYAMIDSARSGYREVLVTYTVEGKTARKCLFIKEVKGKDKNYYFAEAKKEIAASIKDGTLAKSASKQLGHGVAKPVLITLSAVLAAGALGTGGYFLGTYLGGGNNPGPVETTYTVALHAGTNGYFNQPGTLFVIFENVTKGTALNAISGYALPKSDYEMDFSYWQVGTSDVKFNETDVVTSDLVLTANFKDNLISTRNKTKKEVNSVYENIKNSVDPVAEKDLISLLETMIEDLNKSDSIFNTTENQDLVKNIGEFTKKSMYTITYADPSIRNQLYNVYQGKITELEETSKNLSAAKANAIAKMSDAYIAALADEKAKQDALDRIYNDMESVIKNTETTDEVANLITYFAEGAIKTGSYIPTDSQYDDLYNAFLNGITGCANAILAKKQENPTDNFLIETLGNLTNNYYLAIANASDIQQDYVPISNFYNTALNSYPGATFVEKEAYKLHEECLKSLSNINGNVGITSEMFSQIIGFFKNSCQNPAIDTDAKVSIIENVCKSIIKGVGHNADKNVMEFTNVAVELIVNSNFDQNMINFINIAADTAANMPAIDSIEVKSGAGYQALTTYTSNLGKQLLDCIKKDPQTEEEKKQKQDLMNCLMNLGEGFIQSARYCDATKLLLSQMPNLMEWYMKIVEAIKTGMVIDSINAEALIMSGLVRELARTMGKFLDGLGHLSNVDGSIGALETNLKAVREQEKTWASEELFFAQSFNKSLSKAFYDHRAWFLKGDGTTYKRYIDEICNLPSLLVGQDPKVWEDNIKFCALFMGSENFFYAETADGNPDYNAVTVRIKRLLDDSCYTMGWGSPIYDQVLAIWENQFFSKITSTTNDMNFNKLYSETTAAIEALLK